MIVNKWISAVLTSSQFPNVPTHVVEAEEACWTVNGADGPCSFGSEICELVGEFLAIYSFALCHVLDVLDLGGRWHEASAF